MSVVIAIKDNNKIYMCADTLTTNGDGKEINAKIESNFKITKLPNGILIGHVGRVAVSQQLWIHDEWFEPLPPQGLTKEFLVTQVVPKYREKLKEMNFLDDCGKARASYIIAWKDRLFCIMQDFTVVVSNTYLARGIGRSVALSYLRRSDLSVEERLKKALGACGQYYTSISAPYLFIDTERLEFSIEGETYDSDNR